MIHIKDLTIVAPMFQVRIHMTDNITEVNEYTLRNMQLAVANKILLPFWILNTSGGWEKCRKDGILAGNPHSDQYKPTYDGESAMSLTAVMAMRLLQTTNRG